MVTNQVHSINGAHPDLTVTYGTQPGKPGTNGTYTVYTIQAERVFLVHNQVYDQLKTKTDK